MGKIKAEYLKEILKITSLMLPQNKKRIKQNESLARKDAFNHYYIQRLNNEHQNELGVLKLQKNAQFEGIAFLHKKEIEKIQQDHSIQLMEEREKTLHLKYQCINLQNQMERSTKIYSDYRKLMEKIQLLKQENDHLKGLLIQIEGRGQNCQKLSQEILILKRKLKATEDSNGIINGEFQKLKKERDQLYTALSKSVQSVQNSAINRNISIKQQLDQVGIMIDKIRQHN